MNPIQINNDLILREIEENDYQNYLKLMYEFTNYNYNISNNNFIKNLINLKSNNLCNIIVIFSKSDNKLIGAGSIFKLIKLHNNPIGQIEDVIITEKYKGNGLGKKIINNLIKIGLNKLDCYKIILNCNEKNVDFYKKCNFDLVGYEMKYITN
jgi:glucosamine-phosphate N-acetyltransferase